MHKGVVLCQVYGKVHRAHSPYQVWRYALLAPVLQHFLRLHALDEQQYALRGDGVGAKHRLGGFEEAEGCWEHHGLQPAGREGMACGDRHYAWTTGRYRRY